MSIQNDNSKRDSNGKNSVMISADDLLFAEIYDQGETGTEDIELIRTLLPSQIPLNILECFSGSGRILIPLAEDGHRLTGIDISEGMTARARIKLARVDREVQDRVILKKADVFGPDWGRDFDVVILGGNCMFNIESPDGSLAALQEETIRRAYDALRVGGHVYVDNEDPVEVSEKCIGETWNWGGTTADGTMIEVHSEIVSFEPETGETGILRRQHITAQDGREARRNYLERKRPVSGDKVEAWLVKQGFVVVQKFGSRKGMPYTKGKSESAIFWARKQ